MALGEATHAINASAAQHPTGQVAGRFARSAHAFEDSMRDLPKLLLVTVLLIDMILAILYEHFIHPITILPSLPLAALLGTL